jgi:hypothetical protein
VTDAYNIFWILLTLTGVWMLYATLRAISDPALPLRRTFLVVLAMVWRSMLCTGVNYTLFRFILPCFLALTIDRRLRGGNAVRAMLLIAPCYAALLLVSPEMALSFAMGLTVYVALFWAPRGRAQIVAALGSLALIAAITWFAAQHGTFLILSAFSTGGFNFPIMPAPHILVFLLSIALCAAYVGRQFRARRPTPLVLLIAVSAASVAGALGRCDAGHVFLDPLGITIAALLLGSTTSRAGTVYFAAVITFFIVLPGALTLVMLRTTPRLAAQPNAGLQVPDVDRRFGLPAGTTVEVPFGISTSRFGTLHSPQIDQGYYLGLLGALTPAAVENKVAELAQHPARPLLLPEHYEDNCRIDAKMHRRFLSIVFLYPYDARVRHTESIYEPLCATIAQHYRLEQPATPEHFDYEVWQPR